MIPTIACLLAAYLLGSVSGALLVGRLRGGVDIREFGSGNAGGTNALRTQGPVFALFTVLIDVGKGWIAVMLPLLLKAGAGWPTPGWLPAACGLAAIVGHVWPVWYGFRGGKGVATLVGAWLALSLPTLGFILLMWLVLVVAFGYVSVGSIGASLAAPLFVVQQQLEPARALLLFSLACALLVVYTHRANLARLRAGQEPRAMRLWLLGARKSR